MASASTQRLPKPIRATRAAPWWGWAAEYFPHASAVAFAGHIGALADKVNFRRGFLARHGVNAGGLVGLDQVDAALGALTGLIGLAEGHTWVGEGTDAMLLPARELPVRFARADGGARLVPAEPAKASPPVPRERVPCLCG